MVSISSLFPNAATAVDVTSALIMVLGIKISQSMRSV
jgi:hypothetical protein